MTIKFSNYLDKIRAQNRYIALDNKRALRQKRDKDVKPLIHVPTKDELEAKFNSKFENINLLAKIGHSGSKIHKVTVNALKTPDGYILWEAYSDCGSQKWSSGGKSPIFPFENNDLTKVTCDKCLGVRVVGGKKPEPSTTRKVIDPETRPKIYYFTYKTEYPNGAISKQREFAKGMTPEEAWEKIYKREMRYHTKIHDKEIDTIYYWNYKLIWRKPKV